jgi:competence protein ComEC
MQPAPHRQIFCANPLVPLAIALAAGILGARFLSISPRPLLILGALTSILALVALLRSWLVAATLFLAASFLLAGACLMMLGKSRPGHGYVKELIEQGTIADGEPVELTGVLERSPESAPASMYLTVRVERLSARSFESSTSGVVLLFAPIHERTAAEEYQGLELRYGARIRVMTALSRADDFRNPGGSSFSEYLDRKGYDATGFVKSPLLIERLDDERVFLPLAWLFEWRRQLESLINLHFTSETAGVLNASLLGNRYYLSGRTAERFREGGTFHVLVISGWHISVIGGIAFLIARRLTKKRGRQFLLSTTALWCYALAVGAEVSVIRAALMFSIITFAPVVGRQGASLNSLGAAAIVLLVWRPNDLFDPSFQLTFMSVLAILVFAWPVVDRMSRIGSWRPNLETPYPPSASPWFRSFCELLYWREREWVREAARLNYGFKPFKTPMATVLERYHIQPLLRWAFASLIVTLAVQLTLLPLLIVYFHRVSVSSLVLNIGVSLMMALLAVTSIVGMMVAQLSSALAMPLLNLSEALNWLMVHSVDPFSRFGIASFRLPAYSGGKAAVYVLYYVPVVVLAVLLFQWNPLSRPENLSKSRRSFGIARGAAVALTILLAVSISHPLSATPPDGNLRIDFLDVGQGDSALVTAPDGTTLLVDGGGRPNFFASNRRSEDQEEDLFERDTRGVGESVVSEYLWWRGLDRVDYILATHADADHIAGLNDVARNFEVGAALVVRTPSDDPEFAKFSESLRQRTIPLNVIGAGDVLYLGGIEATVHWPLLTTEASAPSENNQSLVLQLRFGDRAVLMTGDVEKESEASIVGSKLDLRSDVVKVPHHGSRTSSTDGFVAATRPAFAIFSVGRRSIFGHPHPEVVERWKANGAEVLTTGKSGMVTVTTDGRDLRVQSFVRK